MPLTQENDWSLLLEADEFWPRLLEDDPFWLAFEQLEPGRRDDAFIRRITTDPLFISAPDRVRERHVETAALLAALIQMIGVPEARKRLQRTRH